MLILQAPSLSTRSRQHPDMTPYNRAMLLRTRVAVVRSMTAAASLAIVVLAYRRWIHVNPTTVALTLLLLILLLAAEWGLRYAVVIAVAATACYNFFFLPPVGTFTITDPQNWLALFAFLITAIIASRLSERAREQAAIAETRRREVELLFRLSRELMQTDSVASLLSLIPNAVADVTEASSAAIFLVEGDRFFPSTGMDASSIQFSQLRTLTESLAEAHTEDGDLHIPVRSGVRTTGLLLLEQAKLSTATADAIGGLVGISIDRVEALESAARGKAAEESERLRALMADSVTHELRTPLTSIKGAATALLQSNMPMQQSQELLQIIDEECDRMNRLVTESMEMAQLDQGSMQLRLTTLSVDALINRALQTCPWVEERHTLRTEVPGHIGVTVDPHLMSKVICNLLENAAKYSGDGTKITISASRSREYVTIRVADQGAGIDPLEQSLIFERFYRGRSGQAVPGGTGMGLAISRAIVEAHQGYLDVMSQPGRGSTFSVHLPLSREQ